MIVVEYRVGVAPPVTAARPRLMRELMSLAVARRRHARLAPVVGLAGVHMEEANVGRVVSSGMTASQDDGRVVTAPVEDDIP